MEPPYKWHKWNNKWGREGCWKEEGLERQEKEGIEKKGWYMVEGGLETRKQLEDKEKKELQEAK